MRDPTKISFLFFGKEKRRGRATGNSGHKVKKRFGPQKASTAITTRLRIFAKRLFVSIKEKRKGMDRGLRERENTNGNTSVFSTATAGGRT